MCALFSFILCQNGDREFSKNDKLITQMGVAMRELFTALELGPLHLNLFPKQVKLAGLKIEVKLVDFLLDSRGLANYIEGTILILRQNDVADMLETFFHEWVHHACKAFGHYEFGDDEALVQRTATMLARAWTTMEGSVGYKIKVVRKEKKNDQGRI